MSELRKEMEEMRQAQKGEFLAVMDALGQQKKAMEGLELSMTRYQQANERQINRLISELDKQEAHILQIEDRLDRAGIPK